MRLNGVWPAVILAGVVAAAPVAAQTVRGIVTERNSGVPLSGVLVTLVRDTLSASPALVSALTNDRGSYVLRAPAAGRYLVGAKRIGVRRFTSEELELTGSQERVLNIQLEPVVFQLPEVRVVSGAMCASRANQAQRVAALWEEARTALTATQISLRDRLFRARVVRYSRDLEPRTLTITEEHRRQTDGVVERAFYSLSGDSLSRAGYWRTLPNDSVAYYAPDADVLLSHAFLRDHCFSVVEGNRDRAGLTGLSFSPVSDREKPDVIGTIWLDAKTFELRLVEFRYTQLPPASGIQRVGGEVHFARLPTGAWVVHRWFIRMPRYLNRVTVRSSGIPGEAPMVVPTIARLIEEGGTVTAEGLVTAEKPASLTGFLLDSAGGALRGASLRVQGTRLVARPDSTGRFQLDSIAPGTYTLVAEHPGYDALGLTVGQQDVTLEPGSSRTVAFRAVPTDSIVARLCQGKKAPPRMATLRVTVLDSVAGIPIRGVGLRLSWKEYGPSTSGQVSITPRAIEATTDARGSVAFCELPADQPLTLALVRDRGDSPLTEWKLMQAEVATRVVRVPRR